jgi:peroxiredoxin/predicted 2-oxoglutarate/Fe(II)-dependent dioxygenase YbiX
MAVNSSFRVLQVGDRIPELPFRAGSGTSMRVSDYIGKPWLMIVCAGDDPPAQLLAFRDAHDQLSRHGVQVIAFAPRTEQWLNPLTERYQLPFPLLADPEGFVCTMLGAAAERPATARAILTDSSTRILKIYEHLEPPLAMLTQLLQDIPQALHPEEPRRVVRQAPVLLIPKVLPPRLCERLIDVWEKQGNQDSGYMKEVEGRLVGVYDYQSKIRRDHFLQGGPVEEEVKACIAARLLPEVQIAFNYAVTRREDFRIACYDAARGGYFRPHRDNTTAATAHRRFALSLLLNDDYEGGYLRFPEYAPHLYRPEAGGAAVFSCSLLHEATNVTAGRRFVLISFFYGEREAKMRQEHSRRTGGTYQA